MAKELCMVENNDRGREARRYFIECEKHLQIGQEQFDQIKRENIELKRAINRITSDGYHADVEKLKEIKQAYTNVRWRVSSLIEQTRIHIANQSKLLEILEHDIEIMDMYEEFHGPYELTKLKKPKLLK